MGLKAFLVKMMPANKVKDLAVRELEKDGHHITAFLAKRMPADKVKDLAVRKLEGQKK